MGSSKKPRTCEQIRDLWFQSLQQGWQALNPCWLYFAAKQLVAAVAAASSSLGIGCSGLQQRQPVCAQLRRLQQHRQQPCGVCSRSSGFSGRRRQQVLPRELEQEQQQALPSCHKRRGQQQRSG
jgi:hypothetical protein